MPRVYRSAVKETTHKALLESPHPNPTYQAQPAPEEAAHTEATHTDMLPDTAADTPRDIKADTPPDIEADTPPLDNVAHVDTSHSVNDDGAHADIVLGPPSAIDSL